MKRMFAQSVIALLCLGFMVASPLALASSAADPDGTPQLLTDLQFNSPGLSAPGWTFGSQNGGAIAVSSTVPPSVNGDSSFALEANYPASTTGGQYVWADYSVAALTTEDIYIEFWAKMPDAKEGCKFLKIFGQRSTADGFANATLGANYTGGDQAAIVNVEFGDGSSILNDGQNAIFLNGTHPSWIGRSYGTATVITPQPDGWSGSNWGTSWHHFRVHVKFNSGTTSANEVPNGEIYVEIDGKVYIDATGLYNRNPANGPINYIELGGWAQTDPSSFDVWYDNVTISTGGFLSEPLPMPPTNVNVS